MGTVAISAVMSVAAASSGHATGPGESFENYRTTYTLNVDGSMQVTVDFEYGPGRDGGHGPYLRVPVQVATDDPDTDRAYPLSEVSATSPDAPADVRLTTKKGVTTIYVGDPEVTVAGVHSYRVSYRQDGVVTPGQGAETFDWTVVENLEVWMSKTSAVITAPAPAVAARCTELPDRSSCEAVAVVDPGSTHPSFANWAFIDADGNFTALPGTAIFSAFLLPSGTGMAVAADYPAGTFPGAVVIDADPSVRTAYVFEWTPMTIAATVALGAIGLALAIRLALWPTRRDSRATWDQGPSVSDIPVAVDPWGTAPAENPLVRRTPPEGVAPWQIVGLTTGAPGSRDLAALLTDLARRDVITIESRPDVSVNSHRMGNWTFRLTPTPLIVEGSPHRAHTRRWERFTPAERIVLEAMFGTGETVTLAVLRGRRLDAITKSLARQSRSDAVRSGWFRPGVRFSQAFRRVGNYGTLAVIVTGVFTLSAAWSRGAGLPAVIALGGLAAAGIIAATVGRTGRSARGVELARQSTDFETHLRDIAYRRHPLGDELRYSPYAVALSLADPFAELAKVNASLHRDTAAATTPWWAFVGIGTSDMLARVPSSSSGSDSNHSSFSDSGSSGGDSGSSGGGGGDSSAGGW